jgi:prophage maintenance system killer protein
MTANNTPRPVSELFADQNDPQRRLESLRGMDYAEFKNVIIQIHNAHPDIENETDFTDKQNGTNYGDIFPRPEDKDGLLAYALEQAQAQDDIKVAAFMLGVAISATHPFHDGNGRTTRVLYGYLAHGLDADDPRMQRARSSEQGVVRMIDFSLAIDEGYIDQFAYWQTEVPKIATKVWFTSADQKEKHEYTYSDKELHGLNQEEQHKIADLFGLRKDFSQGFVDGTVSDAVVFGLSKLAQEQGQPQVDGSRIYVPDVLASMSGDTKRQFIEYIRQYHTLKAQMAVDLIGKYGDTPIADGTVREHLMDKAPDRFTERA